ncbi:hypothetical protein QFZ52_002915 [Arthrobacter woluwensis]|nr:hypothetical protein [Arthrobacter woluwensis]
MRTSTVPHAADRGVAVMACCAPVPSSSHH